MLLVSRFQTAYKALFAAFREGAAGADADKRS